MIDEVREQIQKRLEQIADEIDRLRKALAALDPRTPNESASKRPARPRTMAPRTTTRAAKPASTRRASASRASASASRSNGRSAPGATRAAVLAALAGGDAMTATEVATKAGIARPTVSTTLSRLAKSGEVEKAERGYRLAAAAPVSPPK